MKISVVIPVYNQAPYLAECLDSVLVQTLRDIEVVCVDDGSTDDSGRMLDEYAARDSRVKVIHQANAGAGPARNAGMDVAAGEFLAFMDPDDLYPDEGVLEDVYSAAVANGVKICGGSLMEFLPNGAERTKYGGLMAGMVFAHDGFVDYRDWQFDYGYVRFVYSRDMIQRAGIRFPAYARYQDPPFFVRAMAAAGRFYALRRVTYRCRIRAGGVDWTAAGARRFKALCDGIRDVAEFAMAAGLEDLAALQKERVLHNFGDLFFDDVICRMAWWRAWRLFKALGFQCRVRRWHVWLGWEPSSLASFQVRRPEQIGENKEERNRLLYIGDIENFGKAYADGMAELRKGALHEA